MRNILQEIFERYLNAERAYFDTSVRELWPTERLVPRNPWAGAGSGSKRGREAAREGQRLP